MSIATYLYGRNWDEVLFLRTAVEEEGEQNEGGGHENKQGEGNPEANEDLVVPTLTEYVSAFENNLPQTNSPTVLEHLKGLVMEDKDLEHVVIGSSSRYIEAFIKILADRIPESKRSSIPKTDGP